MGKISLLAMSLALLAVNPALAERSRMRVASEPEIRERLNERSKKTTKARNGYTYQSGKSVGYKLSNGKLCLLYPSGQKNCVDVETDGKRFQLVDRNGDRADL
ncbi:hypothetical protein SAMN03159496_06158 [Rhizobium sp. NFR07]|uniref:hypothetical protein n=1 Tax=Rhizobium sp. NFR07 TaxID=1566262 RepID=UPI0008ECB55D|nr:hypothetical protein [Rhizobium sp. NFR07]SFB63051.1 hypothetical protein SAMN03159496_06158 [Rhizobium sp. NFR07]